MGGILRDNLGGVIASQKLPRDSGESIKMPHRALRARLF